VSLIHIKLTATKGAIYFMVLEYTILHQLEKEELKLNSSFLFYFLGEHKTVIYGTVVQYICTSFNHVPKPLHQKHSTVSVSVQTVPAVAVYAALQEVHKWNWTGVIVCVCVCVWGGGGGVPFYVLLYLVVRHDYENIKVQDHNILWQFCILYCSTIYLHTEVSR
jgi:hypothetical protein